MDTFWLLMVDGGGEVMGGRLCRNIQCEVSVNLKFCALFQLS